MRGKQLSLIAQAHELQKAFDGLVDMKNKRLSLWSQLLLHEKFYLLLVGRVPDHHEQVTLPSEDMLRNLKNAISDLKADQVLSTPPMILIFGHYFIFSFDRSLD